MYLYKEYDPQKKSRFFRVKGTLPALGSLEECMFGYGVWRGACRA